MNEQRRALLNSIASWQYEPFLIEGVPAEVEVIERISEVQRPAEHIPLPDVSAENVEINLERTICFGTCPAYRVTLDGDGRVVYDGKASVDVQGHHEYRVPPQSVARLIDHIRSKDVWSMAGSYSAFVSDNPSTEIKLRFGNETHRIYDYAGDRAGMPPEISELEEEIDQVSEAASWVHLSKIALTRLSAENFDFRSKEAGRILARAIASPDHGDEDAILELMNRGAPVTDEIVLNPLGYQRTLVQHAQANGYTKVVAALTAPSHRAQTGE